jgi:hypothetical protein
MGPKKVSCGTPCSTIGLIIQEIIVFCRDLD